MKRILWLLIFIPLFVIPFVVTGQTDGARVLTGSAIPPLPFNIIPNPNFEDRTTGWSVTTGTFTTTQTAADVARGRLSASWTLPSSAASGAVMQTAPITIPPGLYGRGCTLFMLYKGNALTQGAMVIDAYDGTTAYGAQALADTSTYLKGTTVAFDCPTSGTLRLRVRTTATLAVAPTAVYFDEAYLGDIDSLGGTAARWQITTKIPTAASTVDTGSEVRSIVYLAPASAVTLSSSTPLTSGIDANDGYERLLCGTSDTNTVTIGDSGNVDLQAGITLGLNDCISLIWKATGGIDKWLETGRAFDTLTTAQGGTGQDFSASTGLIKVSAGTMSAASLVNADVDASAAIDFSKLGTLTSGNILVGNGSNVAASVNPSGDVDIDNTGVFAIGSGVIVNGDVNASAAIDFSKLAALSSGNLLIGSAGNVATSVNPSGDVDIDNTGVFSIGSGVIVNGDVNASAAIDRSKIANGTADHVVINSGAGALSSEAQLAITRGGTGQATATLGFNALDPLTTKGDLVAHDGTNSVRHAVGTNGQYLVADSAETNGLKWVTTAPAASEFLDGDFRIQNTGDNTKKLALDVSAVTTATTRTWAVPNASSTLVGTDVSQTLSNKSYNGTLAGTTGTNFTLTSADGTVGMVGSDSATYAVAISTLNYDNGTSGGIRLNTGDAGDSLSNSGNISIYTGTDGGAGGAKTGDIFIVTGSQTDETGSVAIKVGKGAGITDGSIYLDASTNGLGGNVIPTKGLKHSYSGSTTALLSTVDSADSFTIASSQASSGTGGSVTIAGGETLSGIGGGASVIGGDGTTSGGNILIQSGAGPTASDAGLVQIFGDGGIEINDSITMSFGSFGGLDIQSGAFLSSAAQYNLFKKEIRYEETGIGVDYIAIKTPTVISASYDLTLPTTDGDAGQALTTDGSGVLSWSTPSTVSGTTNHIPRFDTTTSFADSFLKTSTSSTINELISTGVDGVTGKQFYLKTANTTVTNDNSGPLYVETGVATGTGDSGTVYIRSGTTGQGAGTVSGDVNIGVGAAATKGRVIIGGDTNLLVSTTYTDTDIPIRWGSVDSMVNETYVGIRAPSEVETSYSMIWPAAQGSSGQTLVNDGSGALSWVDRAKTDLSNVASTAIPVDVNITVAGKGVTIKEGSNARMGTCTLVLGTCTVSNTSVTANTRIFLTVQSLGTVTVPSAVAVSARTASTSFVILASDLTDTSVVGWMMVEPN